MARRRSLNGVRGIEFFDNKVAFRGDAVATQSGPSHLTDALCDARLPIHEDVEIVGIKHQQARSGDSGHGRGSARATQRCDLAEEMTGTQPNTFVLELDLHFPAAMKYMECAGSPRLAMTSPASTCCACSSRMMSAISIACSSANKGTRATIPHVTTKSRR